MTLKKEKIFWQTTVLGLVLILFSSPINSGIRQIMGKNMNGEISMVGQVGASDIYPLFTCPCCDQPLNKEEPCCGAMTQMIDFIDEKVGAGDPKEDIVLATAQEFGLERLTNESDQEVLRQQLIANAPEDAPKITVSEVKKDLGIVSQKNGVVNTEFVIKNEGKSDLVIKKLSSSCGCTSGSLIYQGEEGPRFYMAGHGYEEPEDDWQVAIMPGDEAVVKVYYDPAVHEDLVGAVTRTVSIHSNDPVDFEVKLTISLEQTK